MNEVIKGLMERKSMQVYLDKGISAGDKKAILIAAMTTPTAGNQRLCTILDITDQSLKETLARTCDNQLFIARAKAVLIFCVGAKRWQDVFLEAGCNPREPGVDDLVLAVEDVVTVTQNAATVVESLGIGSCHIGDIVEQCETHRELLHLPKYVFPAAMVVFGYPNGQQKARKKSKRRRLEDVVHESCYREIDGEKLREMFGKKYPDGTLEEWTNALCRRKYNNDFSRGMTCSVGGYLKDFE